MSVGGGVERKCRCRDPTFELPDWVVSLGDQGFRFRKNIPEQVSTGRRGRRVREDYFP